MSKRSATGGFGYYFRDESSRTIERILGKILKTPEDEIETDYDDVMQTFKTLILTAEFNGVLDVVEAFVDEDSGQDLADRVATLFDAHAAPYWLDVARPPHRFFPRTNKAQGNATREAVNVIRGAGMDGADTHLRRAAEHIREGKYGDAVKDSILAVESVARVIDSKAQKTLGPALKSLEQSGVIQHAALKEAFSKLYGYTNDEQGIRHALLDKAAPAVGLDEAVFMFGACASFSAYLATKHMRRGEGT